MNIIYGILIALVGVYILISASLRSDAIPYRWLVARSKMIWGLKAYLFHQISGCVIIIFGILFAVGVIS